MKEVGRTPQDKAIQEGLKPSHRTRKEEQGLPRSRDRRARCTWDIDRVMSGHHQRPNCHDHERRKLQEGLKAGPSLVHHMCQRVPKPETRAHLPGHQELQEGPQC